MGVGWFCYVYTTSDQDVDWGSWGLGFIKSVRKLINKSVIAMVYVKGLRFDLSEQKGENHEKTTFHSLDDCGLLLMVERKGCTLSEGQKLKSATTMIKCHSILIKIKVWA